MKLKKLRKEIHRRILRLRSIESVLSTPLFCRLWEDSNDNEKRECLAYIRDSDKEAIHNWIWNHRTLELGELPLIKLRELAKRNRVRGWSRLDHTNLIHILQEIRDNAKTQ